MKVESGKWKVESGVCMGIKINYAKDYWKLSLWAAEFVASELKSKKSGFVLGLPTGSTPLGMYERLIDKNRAGELDFSGVTTFNLDEYYPIEKDSEQSYYRFMFDHFFDKINIEPGNVNIPDGEADDPEAECLEYEQKIDRAGGIDLMVLGIGANGHIGFNEPGDFLLPYTHVAELTEETKEANKRFFERAEDVPARALTMGMASIIAKSKKILMLVHGNSKTEVFKQFAEGRITPKNPATFLYLHGDVTVISDIEI